MNLKPEFWWSHDNSSQKYNRFQNVVHAYNSDISKCQMNALSDLSKCLLIKVLGVTNVHGNNKCDDILTCAHLLILYWGCLDTPSQVFSVGVPST